MTDAISWLNANDGAAIVILTLFLVAFNAWLLLETRAVRVEKFIASVEAYPMPYEMASMYLSARIENGGPAIAHDVEWNVTQLQDGKPVEENPHRYGQPLLAAGRHRTMMLHERSRSQMLQEMADANVTWDVEWSWTDGRRRFWVGAHIRHFRRERWDAKELVDDFYQAWVLTETPPMLKLGEMADEVRKAAKEVEKIRRELERLRRLAERPSEEGSPFIGG